MSKKEANLGLRYRASTELLRSAAQCYAGPESPPFEAGGEMTHGRAQLSSKRNWTSKLYGEAPLSIAILALENG